MLTGLQTPLVFAPIYKTVVWGGRRLARWRDDLPDGPIGESWDVSDQDGYLSVVSMGPLAGQALRALVQAHPEAVVGPGHAGDFPLLVKVIDAARPLSVQVHPDDALARSLGVGPRGKTECWYFLEDGGGLYLGTPPGTTRQAFEAALAAGSVAQHLQRFEAGRGDFFFLPARTVHALDAGSLLIEIQQSCDVTFRVDDWGRVGLDGRPRPLHVRESLDTIDFARPTTGAVRSEPRDHPDGGQARTLAECAFFRVVERWSPGPIADRGSERTGRAPRCAVVTCIDGPAHVATGHGHVTLAPLHTASACLVGDHFGLATDATRLQGRDLEVAAGSDRARRVLMLQRAKRFRRRRPPLAAAGAWRAEGLGGALRLLVTTPAAP